MQVPMGANYVGQWTDVSTYVISIIDATGSELNAMLGSIILNPLVGVISNQGCRPGVTNWNGMVGLCNAASEFVGPIMAQQWGQSSPFVATFGVAPAIVLVVVDDPDHGGENKFGRGRGRL